MPEMWQFHSGDWHRYTRWTGRLSHQTSNLSHPPNLLLMGCDLCFTQYQVQGVVIYLVTIKQLKSHQLNVLQEGLGTCIWINKWYYPFWLCQFLERHRDSWSRRSVANRPKCLVPEHPDNSYSSPEAWLCCPFIVPSLNSKEILVTSHNDVVIICSDLLAGKPLCMHIGTTSVHLHIHQHPCWNPKYYESSWTSSSLL